MDFRHVILYCKGHYKKTDLFYDLQIILGNLYESSPDSVEHNQVLRVLTGLVYDTTSRDKFLQLVYEGMHLQSLCQQIRFTDVDRLGYDLGDIDTDILPAKEKKK